MRKKLIKNSILPLRGGFVLKLLLSDKTGKILFSQFYRTAIDKITEGVYCFQYSEKLDKHTFDTIKIWILKENYH